MGPQELSRYSRQILLPEIGREGQEKLKRARVLVVGVGGLGSPLALYLAASGVGHLSILDFDVVELTNLQRQVLYSTPQVGQAKVAAAAKRLRALNPLIEINPINERLTEENALNLFSSHDVIADGTDNFATHYLANDAAVLSHRPLVSASILGYRGQLAVFHHAGGPCYRCLFRDPPAMESVPSCAENGVLGVLPGVMGALQATETLKILLGLGETLHKHLLVFDALTMDFRKMQTMRNADCPVCGDHPTIKVLQNIIPKEHEAPIPQMESIEMFAALKGNQIQLIDLRDADERVICKIPGATHIPFGQLEERLSELDKKKTIVIHCKDGGRSTRAVRMLQGKGIKAMNLKGGIMAWIDRVDPSQTKY